MSIQLKRAYDAPADSDGYRVLVDRVWPRGVSKEQAALDGWFKEIAPSADLRKWFGHDPRKWDEFRSRYFQELDEARETLANLAKKAGEGRVTLVFGARETRYNNAQAIKEYLRRHWSVD